MNRTLNILELTASGRHSGSVSRIDAAFASGEADTTPGLAESDTLVAELEAADVLVIGTPIYNFAIPAALKAWFDQVARPRVTFRYTEDGSVGLLGGKKAYIVVASGGVPVGSPVDFATPYIRHMLGFLGISDVEIVAADSLLSRGDEAIEAARTDINRHDRFPDPRDDRAA